MHSSAPRTLWATMVLAMCRATWSVGIDDDLAADHAGVACWTADDELAGPVHFHTLRIDVFAHHQPHDVGEDLRPHLLEGDTLVVLGGDDDTHDRAARLQSHLRLAVG